jgi:hypothetical protein
VGDLRKEHAAALERQRTKLEAKFEAEILVRDRKERELLDLSARYTHFRDLALGVFAAANQATDTLSGAAFSLETKLGYLVPSLISSQRPSRRSPSKTNPPRSSSGFGPSYTPVRAPRAAAKNAGATNAALAHSPR